MMVSNAAHFSWRHCLRCIIFSWRQFFRCIIHGYILRLLRPLLMSGPWPPAGYLSTNISTNYFFSSQRHAEVPRLTQVWGLPALRQCQFKPS